MTKIDRPSGCHRARRDRLRDRLAAADLRALWVTHLPNVRYLTGFTGSNGQVLVGTDVNDDVFCTDGRYEVQAREEVVDLDLVVQRFGAHDAALRRVDTSGRVGFEAEHLVYADAVAFTDAARERGAVAVPSHGDVEELRLVKDEGEIAVLRRACAVTDDAFDAMLDQLVAGITERAFARLLETVLVERGADAPAFRSIVAFGENSARPHHEPTSRPLARGDVVKLDFGARVDGYHADMTRTLALGSPDAELRAVHELVCEAQAAGLAAADANEAACDVDAACRNVIRDAGYGDAFTHGTGHGVGLEIHERPRVAPEGSDTLAPGVAFTVEPGIYVEGLGGVRIEDTVVMRPDGAPEALTTSPREMLVL